MVEVEPLGDATELGWMLALLLRLEPKPKLLRRELMTSTMAQDRDGEEGEMNNWKGIFVPAGGNRG